MVRMVSSRQGNHRTTRPGIFFNCSLQRADHAYMARRATVDALQEDDPVWHALVSTTAERLSACDPSLMGMYAEHLIADHLGAEIDPDGWGPVDLRWTHCTSDGSTTIIDIQVKSARVHRTFGEGFVKQPAFGTGATLTLEEIQAGQKSARPRRAPVWVFALHTALQFNIGWKFYVCPGAFLDALDRKKMSVTTMQHHGFTPVELSDLQTEVLDAHRRHLANVDVLPESYPCKHDECTRIYPKLQSLVAHEAAAGHGQPPGALAYDASSFTP